jgi:propanol-preferring alcohol dehydrogenase
MKAARLVSFGESLEIVDLPDPRPGSRDAVMRVEASGICRSDWQIWAGEYERIGEHVDLPRVMGHEVAGEVVAIGREVHDIRVGDHVTAPFHEACGVCERCRRGFTNVCDHVVGLGSSHDGGYAEFARVINADINCVRIPDGIDSVSAAAMGCRYITAYRAVVTVGAIRAGEWLAVHGAGAVGLSAVQIGAAAGARVIVTDVDEAKLRFAQEQGAEIGILAGDGADPAAAILEATHGGADVSLDAVGLPSTVRASLGCLRKQGRHVQVGLSGQADMSRVAFPLSALVSRELQILGSVGNPHGQFRELFALVQTGRCRPRELVTREIALEDANSVLQSMGKYATVGFNIITRF